MKKNIECASHAICGKRDYQEDNCIFHSLDSEDDATSQDNNQSQKLLAVLCDGMGGHVGGATASQLACDSFIDCYNETSNNGVDPLKSALDASNAAIAKKVEENGSLKGMGCTLIGAIVENNSLRWVSVGDSLLYHYRSGQLTQINSDHSYGSYLDKLAEMGEIKKEEAQSNPQRHSLLSAVMGEQIEMLDLRRETFPLETNDYIIIASDGIQTLPNQKIQEIVSNNERASKKPQDLVISLTQAVESEAVPYQDNTTVMAIRIQ